MAKSFSGSLKEMVRDFLRIEYGDTAGEDLSSIQFTGPRPPRHASSFPDADTAEDLIDAVLEQHETTFLDWLTSGRPWLMVEATFDRPSGIAADGERVEEVTGVRVVLARAPKMPDGFRVHTGYPQRPRRPRTDLPALHHLVGAYFHQDWDEDYGSYPQALAAFLRESPELARPLQQEVGSLRVLSEDEVDGVLDELGCEYTLHPDESWLRWLDDLARRLERTLAQRPE